MKNAVLMRGFWMDYTYIVRVIFAGFANNGRSLPFLSNSIAN